MSAIQPLDIFSFDLTDSIVMLISMTDFSKPIKFANHNNKGNKINANIVVLLFIIVSKIFLKTSFAMTSSHSYDVNSDPSSLSKFNRVFTRTHIILLSSGL